MIKIVNILCGGKGSRIGGDKPLFHYNQKPLIAHIIEKLAPQCDKIILSLDSKQNPILAQLKEFNHEIIFDNPKFLGLGPMVGVLSGMEYACDMNENAKYFIAPCDMPNLPENYIMRLMEDDEFATNYYKGERDYPLCAMISPLQTQNLRNALENCGKGLGAFRFLEKIGAKNVAIENELNFLNINSAI